MFCHILSSTDNKYIAIPVFLRAKVID